MSGERYYPRLGSSMIIVASLTLTFTLLNTIFGPWPGHMSEKMYGLPLILGLLGIETSQPIWGPTGEFSSQEFLLLGITIVCGAVAIWARRFRPDFVVPVGMTLSQHSEREFSTTQVNTSLIGHSSSPATASIVESIIGSDLVAETPIDNQITNLGAAVAVDVPVPTMAQEFMDIEPVQSVPLPTTEIENVPLPEIPLPPKVKAEPINEVEELVSFSELELDIPELPDFSASTIETPSVEQNVSDLPPLPDL